MAAENRCRLCNNNLRDRGSFDLIDLGMQAFTGIFPLPGQDVPEGELRVVQCAACGLAQLSERFDPNVMYGASYGYRSGLSGAMVSHLSALAKEAAEMAFLQPGDVVLDIGCSDGTLLANFAGQECIGFDPVAQYHPVNAAPNAKIVPRFFSAVQYAKNCSKPATLVTAVAMFYDLDDPVSFLRQINQIMAPDGTLCLELQFMPLCLRNRAIDVICHEHAVYYDGWRLAKTLSFAGFMPQKVYFNHMNGGTVRIYAKKDSQPNKAALNTLLSFDSPSAMAYRASWKQVAAEIKNFGCLLRMFCENAPGGIVGLGASTKGNVLLQHWGLGRDAISAIGEINQAKFGHVTPGTGIPIVDENELPPDATRLVLPWWLKGSMIQRYPEHRLLFPLPHPHLWEAGQETNL